MGLLLNAFGTFFGFLYVCWVQNNYAKVKTNVQKAFNRRPFKGIIGAQPRLANATETRRPPRRARRLPVRAHGVMVLLLLLLNPCGAPIERLWTICPIWGGAKKICILMFFDPPSRQIAKTTVWASPPNQGASFDQVLSRLVFSGKSYEGLFPRKSIVVQLTFPKRSRRLLCNLVGHP